MDNIVELIHIYYTPKMGVNLFIFGTLIIAILYWISNYKKGKYSDIFIMAALFIGAIILVLGLLFPTDLFWIFLFYFCIIFGICKTNYDYEEYVKSAMKGEGFKKNNMKYYLIIFLPCFIYEIICFL